MNHFIYAMKSTDPAPAAGGDTKSWFEYYKWDVDGPTFVPIPDESFITGEPGAGDVLWFVMDDVLLGCVIVEGFLPSLSGMHELHYDTRRIQEGPVGDRAYRVSLSRIGWASDQAVFDTLKKTFDLQHPPRNQAAAEGLPQAAT